MVTTTAAMIVAVVAAMTAGAGRTVVAVAAAAGMTTVVVAAAAGDDCRGGGDDSGYGAPFPAVFPQCLLASCCTQCLIPLFSQELTELTVAVIVLGMGRIVALSHRGNRRD